MAGSGRPKSSSMWNYFTYDKDTDKTTCTVLCSDKSDVVCGKEFKGQFATNLKKHLKSCHNEQYKCFEIDEAKKKEKEQDKRKGTSSSSSKEAKARQSTLPDSYFSTRVYDSKSKKHQAITLRLATFVGATNISLSLIDSAEFCELITEFRSTVQNTTQ